jgi:hypothetical protein
MSEPILKHRIRCKFSGLQIGELSVTTAAGAMAYVSYWDKCLAYHPVFSLSTDKLLKFAKYEWDRLAQRAADQEATQEESDILCVSYLAMLHRLDSLRQDVPALPRLSIVQDTIERLFDLAYWKWHVESASFAFPTLHISKLNGNADFGNIGDYLDICLERRTDYEAQIDDAKEQEKVRAAQRAIKALASEWITPVSKKTLWAWVRAHLPEKYQADGQGWLNTLFLGGSAAIIEFDEDEIDLAEEIITASCPIGTGIMLAVRARLDAIRSTWSQYHKAFEIEMSDFADNHNLFVNGVKVAAPHPGDEPTMQSVDFNRGKFIVAHARWTIAKAAFLKSGGIL